jgi:quinol monooxygenase YgiN
MILVIGHALAKPDTLQAMLAISTEHVLRSRTEPGCI